MAPPERMALACRPTYLLEQAVACTAVIPLSAPLGARAVVDAETGAPLPRVP